MVNDFNFLSKQAKKKIKKCTDWFVNPFVFSSKLAIFIEKKKITWIFFFRIYLCKKLSSQRLTV